MGGSFATLKAKARELIICPYFFRVRIVLCNILILSTTNHKTNNLTPISVSKRKVTAERILLQGSWKPVWWLKLNVMTLDTDQRCMCNQEVYSICCEGDPCTLRWATNINQLPQWIMHVLCDT